MAYVDREYSRILKQILHEGYCYEDPNRKGVFRTEIPSATFRHEFKDGFPVLTTKELNYNNVIVELLWFLKGYTNIKYLVNLGCNIWNKDAYKYYLKSKHSTENPYDYKSWLEEVKKENGKDNDGPITGDLGPVYGHQWRNSNGIDQIQNLIYGLINKPLGTEHIVNSWNPADINAMALPPCHYGFQVLVKPLTAAERFYLTPNANTKDVDTSIENGHIIYLDKIRAPKYGFELHWTQRSVDTFLGLPYNIASYASLALILEQITGYRAIAIQGDLKKVHLYNNSLNAAREQLGNDIFKYEGCKLLFLDEFHYIVDESLVGKVEISKIIDEMRPEWFKLEGYKSYPAINVSMLEKD